MLPPRKMAMQTYVQGSAKFSLMSKIKYARFLKPQSSTTIIFPVIDVIDLHGSSEAAVNETGLINGGSLAYPYCVPF